MPELQRDEQKVDLFTEYDAKRAKIKADVLEADLHAQMETMFMYKETINILRDIVDDKPNILNEKYDTWEKKVIFEQAMEYANTLLSEFRAVDSRRCNH